MQLQICSGVSKQELSTFEDRCAGVRVILLDLNELQFTCYWQAPVNKCHLLWQAQQVLAHLVLSPP